MKSTEGKCLVELHFTAVRAFLRFLFLYVFASFADLEAEILALSLMLKRSS